LILVLPQVFCAALGPFGLLPLGVVGTATIAQRVGLLAFSNGPVRRQILGGLVLTLALFTGGMQLLLHVGGVRPVIIAGMLMLSAGCALIGDRRRTSARRSSCLVRAIFHAASLLPLLLVCAAAIGLACVAAYWLPIWQWDSLGYHLPFVNFVLQGGGLSELPRDVPYLSTYPHNVELLFAGMRALLPDDRLQDIGQLPLGMVGAAAVCGIARELGARRSDALAAGCGWLLLPAVFLQLPTNYVDVGSAAYFLLTSFFLVSPTTRATLLCAGAALGLFLGSKPSVPPAAGLLGILLCAKAARGRQLPSGLLGLLLTALLGFEAYATEWVRHGNPVWPAAIDVGPIHLDGTIAMKELLSSGAGAEKVYGSLPERVLRSWFSLTARPAFDMRVGGFGLVFVAGLGGAMIFILRRPSLLFLSLLAIALVTPDPAVARYVLALPGLLLAGGAVALSFVSARARDMVHLGLAALSAHGVAYEAPGLTGEGPPLWAYAGMSWPERQVAVGADGRPVAFVEATRRLRSGEIAVYDKALSFPYLMWRSDLANRVIRLTDGASEADAAALLAAPGVRLVAVAEDQAAAQALGRGFIHLFTSRERCQIYVRP
jgi:hypothetical protein